MAKKFFFALLVLLCAVSPTPSQTAGPGDSTSDDSRNYNARLKRLSEMEIRSSIVIYGNDASGLQATHMTAADATPPRISGSEGNRSFTKPNLVSHRLDGSRLPLDTNLLI